MNSVEEARTEVEGHLTKEQRQASAACSDCINNSRSMSTATSQGHSNYEDTSLGKKGVETWLQHNEVDPDTETAPEQIATGTEEVHSDQTESPKRTLSKEKEFVFVNAMEETESAQQRDDDGGRGPSEVSDFYEQQFMEEAKKMQETTQKEYRFSMNDIFNNPALEDAAKQELRERPPITPSVSNADSVISLPESRVSHLEQTVVNSENLDRDADRDLQAGHGELTSLIERLNIGRTSVFHILKFVQKLYQAEVGYARSLLAVSRSSVSNVGHSDGFRYASECLCELPMCVRSAHSKVAQNLAECEKSLNHIIAKIKQLSDTLVAETPKLTESVRSKRSALSRSKSRHQAAYKRMESIQEQKAGLGRTDDDPWLTEGQVAHDYTALISIQVSVKKALATAYERVTEVEMLRLETSRNVISSLVHSYGASMTECVAPFVTDVNKALILLDEEEEVTDLKKSQRNSQMSEQALRLQYEEQGTSKCGELFTSPDIIRQGPLQVLDEESRSWINARFVLTKAGLYWYLNDKTDPRPDDFLTLARTSIEQAKAPGLKLVQEGTSYFSWKRAVILRATTVEEYCEWAISLRETIQEITGARK